MFDILPGPTDLREEGLKKKNLHIHVKLKNKYIEKPLKQIAFSSLFFFQFLFASVASPFFYLLALRV